MAKPIKILIAVLLLGVVLGAAGCGNAAGSASAPVIGSPAPDFALKTPDGQTVSLDSLKGHPVLLNFWATWCGPCRQEIPFLQDLSTDPARLDRGLEMVAVDVKETAQTVQGFQQTYGMTYRVLLDSKGQVANLYNIKGVPMTYFIDKDGIIKYVKLGAFSTKKEIEQTLDKTIMKE
jgi:cytochrome c biogenesis protein CcmG/thiol:disulfide interchange protein DsbE